MGQLKQRFFDYIDNIFDRKTKLSLKGVSVNSDGSTNNLPDYIHHSRTVISKSVIFYYVASLIWAYFCGFFCYTLQVNAMKFIIGSDGKTNDYWGIGTNMLFANIISHHLMILIETRHINILVVIWYAISFGTLFVNIWLNDTLVDEYYMTQWSIMLCSPLFYLTLILEVFVIVLPRLMQLCLHHIVVYPEFAKVRGRR